MATVHIESKLIDIANIVLMPGDPNRAKYIAKKYLKRVRLVNSVRGITAYTGYYKKKRITIFPSGMGIPSMGIYSYELFKNYNVNKIIRIGSCGAYQEQLKLNDLILVDYSVSESTYAKILNNYSSNKMASNKKLNKIINTTAKDLGIDLFSGNIYCSDVFYEQKNNYKEKIKKDNVLGVEMETFALFSNAKLLNREASAILTVSDSFCYKEKLTAKEREQNLNKMIVLALESCLKS